MLGPRRLRGSTPSSCTGPSRGPASPWQVARRCLAELSPECPDSFVMPLLPPSSLCWVPLSLLRVSSSSFPTPGLSSLGAHPAQPQSLGGLGLRSGGSVGDPQRAEGMRVPPNGWHCPEPTSQPRVSGAVRCPREPVGARLVSTQGLTLGPGRHNGTPGESELHGEGRSGASGAGRNGPGGQVQDRAVAPRAVPCTASG